jgi:hypothetical protein
VADRRTAKSRGEVGGGADRRSFVKGEVRTMILLIEIHSLASARSSRCRLEVCALLAASPRSRAHNILLRHAGVLLLVACLLGSSVATQLLSLRGGAVRAIAAHCVITTCGLGLSNDPTPWMRHSTYAQLSPQHAASQPT